MQSEALQLLHDLKTLVPREPSIYFLLGKVYENVRI